MSEKMGNDVMRTVVTRAAHEAAGYIEYASPRLSTGLDHVIGVIEGELSLEELQDLRVAAEALATIALNHSDRLRQDAMEAAASDIKTAHVDSAHEPSSQDSRGELYGIQQPTRRITSRPIDKIFDKHPEMVPRVANWSLEAKKQFAALVANVYGQGVNTDSKKTEKRLAYFLVDEQQTYSARSKEEKTDHTSVRSNICNVNNRVISLLTLDEMFELATCIENQEYDNARKMLQEINFTNRDYIRGGQDTAKAIEATVRKRQRSTEEKTPPGEQWRPMSGNQDPTPEDIKERNQIIELSERFS